MDREDECLRLQLEDLKKQLGKKQKFEEAVFSLKSLLRDRYPSAAPSLRILVRLSLSAFPLFVLQFVMYLFFKFFSLRMSSFKFKAFCSICDIVFFQY